MKKITVIILFFTMIALFLESVEIKNENSDNQQKKELPLIQILEISDEIDSFEHFFIHEDKIFVCSVASKMVHIMDLGGKVIKTISETGQGPGEFSMPTNLINDPENNRFGVVDQMNRRTSYFDYNGNYIEDIIFEGLDITLDRIKIETGYLNMIMRIDLNQEEGKILVKPTLELVLEDSIKILYQSAFSPLELNISSFGFPVYTVAEDAIYISVLNPREYRISKYDLEGKYFFDIIKSYKKVKKSEEEIEETKAKFDEIKKQMQGYGADIEFKDYEYEFAVNTLLIAPDNTLWVLTQNEVEVFFDQIDDNGKITNRVYSSEDDFKNCYFYKGKLYDFTGNEDDGFEIRIYDL